MDETTADQICGCRNQNPHEPHTWMDRESFPTLYRCPGVYGNTGPAAQDVVRDRNPFPNLETKSPGIKPHCCTTAYATNGFQHGANCKG